MRGYIGFFLMLLVLGCSQKETHNIKIHGQLSEYQQKNLYLYELDVKESQVLDSAITDQDGKFEFRLLKKHAGFLMLGPDPETIMLLQYEPGEKIELQSHDIDFANYTVSGSPGSALLANFEDFRLKQKEKIDSLGTVLLTSRGMDNFITIKQQTDEAYDQIIEDIKTYAKQFVNENNSSLSSLIVINHQFERVPLFDKFSDFQFLHTNDSILQLKYPDNPHVIENAERVRNIRLEIYDDFMANEKLKPGEGAPKVVMKDPDGNLFSLNDQKGSKVLLYFWSAFDNKSRKIHKKLHEVYPGFLKNNIKVFGVSVIENKKVWESAIEMDSILWLQGSDLKGEFSPVFKKYNLYHHVPSFYFIDEEGTIIFRSYDIDEMLEQIAGLQ